MNWLMDSLYPGDSVTLLVFNVLIQITVVILLTLFVARRLLRHGAAVRHAAWLTCLVFVAACPLITWAANRAGVSMVSLSLAPNTTASTEPEESEAPSPIAITPIDRANRPEPLAVERPIGPTARPSRPIEETRFERATETLSAGPQPAAVTASTAPIATSRSSLRSTVAMAVSIAMAIWATGSLLFAIRLLHGGLYLCKLARGTTPLDESGLVDVLTRVRRSLGVTDLPPILLCQQITTPVVATLCDTVLARPAILLPASLPTSITRDSLHDVLVHECAHIIRRDHWVGILQRLVETVYWFHPLVHHMNRRLAFCREEVCDNHVLAAVGPTDYADTLLGLAVGCQSRIGAVGSLGMFGLRWPLEDRVRGLLDGHRDRRVRLGNRSRLAVLVSACVVVTAAAMLQIDTVAGEKEDKHRTDDVLVERVVTDTQAPSPNEEVLDVDGNPQKPGHDLDGEPLPRGAVARLGSRRLRHEGWWKRIWIAPDNKTLISSSPNNGVRLWNADTGKFLRELDLAGKYLTAVDLSRDGKSLAVLARITGHLIRESTCEVRLWDTSTWQSRTVATWIDSTSDHKCVAISSDAKTMATSNERGNVRLWDIASGKELLDHSVATQEIKSLAFSPDGVLLAVAARRSVSLWDWASEEEPKALKAPVERTQIVTFSPDGRLLVTGSDDDFAARIWDVASRQLVSRLKGEAGRYGREGLTFSSDGKSLIVPANSEKTVEIFDVETGRLRQSLDAGLKTRDVAISTDGRLVASVGSEGAITLWSLPDGKRLSDRFTGHGEAAYEIVFTPDGQHVVTGGRDGTIRVWEADTGRQIRSLGSLGWVCGVAISPDGKKIASCSHDQTVRLWDFESGRQIFNLSGHGRLGGNDEYIVDFVPDGKRFLSFGLDMYLRVWSTQTGKALAEHAIRPSGIKLKEAEDGTLRLVDPGASPVADGGLTGVLRQARFTADRERFFLSDWHSIYWFDVESGREIDKLTPEDTLNNAYVSPDGGKLVTVESRRPKPDPARPDAERSRSKYMLKIYQLPSKKMVRQIELPGTVGQTVVFSPNGRFVASRISVWKRGEPTRRWISVWDLESGNEVAHIDGYDRPVSKLAFSPDGRRLASTHDDTTILVWDLEAFRSIFTVFLARN